MYTETYLTYLYNHYLDLFHNYKTFEARSFARREVNRIGTILGFTKHQLREDKLPRVDFAKLFNCVGNIAGDGEE